MSTTPPYVPPYVGPAGLVVNGYASILADNLAGFQNIYGVNQFIGVSSPIYQLLSILSAKQADQNNALLLCYNQSSPQTAVGAGLDRAVKMNGLARAAFTYSTVSLLLTASSSATVTVNNGFAQDQNGNLWALPNPTAIVGGSTTVTATCTTPGAITAEPGTITIKSTPVSGWASVTNPAAAVAGNPVETDSQLRARQMVSVALPALTPIAATIAAVLAVKGVTAVAPGVPTPGGAQGTSIENPTGAPDSWGNPAHSISMVVIGGADADVALAIYQKKTIGCYTNGSTSVVVADPTTGVNNTIDFYRPTYVSIFVAITLHGYSATPTTAQQTAVQTAMVAYLTGAAIGETISIAALSAEAMLVNTSLEGPTFTVQSLEIGAVTASTTATTTSAANTITVASATGVVSGQYIAGAGIPLGATVTGVSGTTVTMSQNATVTASGVAVSFYTVAASDVAMPNYHSISEGATGTTYVATA